MGDLLKRNSFINLEVCVLADYVKSLMNKGYSFKKFLLIQLEISKSCSCTMLLRNVLVVIGLAVEVEFQKFALLVTTLSYSGFVTRIALPMKFEYDISTDYRYFFSPYRFKGSSKNQSSRSNIAFSTN